MDLPDQDRHPAPAPPELPAPRLAILFSGHLMDRPDRAAPRFPPALEAAAARQIGTELDRLAAGPQDLALCQAAAGGDLLFLEACQARGLRVQVLLPIDEARFVRESVLPCLNGAQWARRYQAVRAGLTAAPRVLPAEPGGSLAGGAPAAEAFERCNEWLLSTGLQWGADSARFICLWNGGASSGPGGTAGMVARARQRGLEPQWIDTRLLPAA